METKTINTAWDRPRFSEVSVAATVAQAARTLGYTAEIGATPDPDRPDFIVDLLVSDGELTLAIQIVNSMNATYVGHIESGLEALGIPCAWLVDESRINASGPIFPYGFNAGTNELFIVHRDGAATPSEFLQARLGRN